MSAALRQWPSDGGEPTFAAPWEARIFAIVVALDARGAWPWDTFVAALAAAGRDAPADDDGSGAYRRWYAAALGLLVERGIVDPRALAGRAAAIAEERRRGHGHVARTRPISVAPPHQAGGPVDGGDAPHDHHDHDHHDHGEHHHHGHDHGEPHRHRRDGHDHDEHPRLVSHGHAQSHGR